MKIMIDVPDDTVAITVSSVRITEEQTTISCHTAKTKNNQLLLLGKDGQWYEM